MTRTATGSLDPRGPVAETIADLWWWLLGLGVVVFAVFAVLLVVALLRRPGDGENRPGHRWILVGGVLMPLAVLVVVFGATVVAMRAMPDEDATTDALVIEITGHQWWFEVSYPDHGVSTVDEVHLPVGRPVAFHLSSADVIHSFWVPELGGKMDLLPEDTNVLVLEADEPGEYGAPCAEFCGLEHARMRVHVVVESPEEFAAWIERQP